ncbi:MAG: bifunctional hydroxymethylpyrimidine kinase/phosphomethylpyrimidine kinase [Chloroflexota bacterium]|nr:bifunctional hydroxymethylpyrimidine kinase/phosphomethylpyrimidine kinase [Chloroflexota bacterium]MDE3193824.1 bifunctional hydroxymethylpyrimidine kinase/phosphomethylpyrimidine kinase [Chloroflexota bacterium]
MTRPSGRERWGRAVALTIAGSDSSAGAGIQADLKTFQAIGVYGTTAITALTAQNTLGVRAVQESTPEIVAAQIDAVAEDLGVDGAKTGMLASEAIVHAVAERVRRWDIGRVLVVDPVSVAKGGDRLLSESALRVVVRELLPLAAVVTPNLPEAAAILGRTVADDDDEIARAARELRELGPRAVVIKGGHRAGRARDVYVDGHTEEIFDAERSPTKDTHGTGCTFSAAIAARIALGDDLVDAVRYAKAFVTRAIERARPLGAGHGPLAHEPLAAEERVARGRAS